MHPNNYKILIKEIKYLNNWRDFPCSWIRRLNRKNVKCPQIILKINAIPIKIPGRIFLGIEYYSILYMKRQSI